MCLLTLTQMIRRYYSRIVKTLGTVSLKSVKRVDIYVLNWMFIIVWFTSQKPRWFKSLLALYHEIGLIISTFASGVNILNRFVMCLHVTKRTIHLRNFEKQQLGIMIYKNHCSMTTLLMIWNLFVITHSILPFSAFGFDIKLT